jgi:hypothetical protein
VASEEADDARAFLCVHLVIRVPQYVLRVPPVSEYAASSRLNESADTYGAEGESELLEESVVASAELR